MTVTALGQALTHKTCALSAIRGGQAVNRLPSRG